MSDRLIRRASALPDVDLNPRREPAFDFDDRPFGELGNADYEELGFLCGLEVHQQLATRSKLSTLNVFGGCSHFVVGSLSRSNSPTPHSVQEALPIPLGVGEYVPIGQRAQSVESTREGVVEAA